MASNSLVCGTFRRSRIMAILLAAVLLQGCAEAVVVGSVGAIIALHDMRSTKVMLKDTRIEYVAGRLLSNQPELENDGHVVVTSFNQVVLLTGDVPSRKMKQKASDLVTGIDGVRRVQNELKVMPAQQDDVWARNSLTTAKVKARLFSRDFDATRVKVVSNQGNVYLMGLVTHSESDAAIKTVQTVAGVHKVVKVFEYVD